MEEGTGGTYKVMYETDEIYDRHEFLWRQADSTRRIELVFVDNEVLTGTSYFTSPDGSFVCYWSVNVGTAKARALCAPGSGDFTLDNYLGLLSTTLVTSAARTRSLQIAGVDGDCFRVESTLTGTGGVCLSSDGIPLQIEWPRVGTLLAATLDRNESNLDIVPLIPEAMWETWKGVDIGIDQLRLPDRPFVQAFRSGCDCTLVAAGD